MTTLQDHPTFKKINALQDDMQRKTVYNQTIQKQDGLHGEANLIVYADGEAWVRFLNRKTTG
ncbi:MAG: hypothetical protein H7Y09_10755, partial [Chitinophagaceae bacterium]|nr:hypothetical protein [Anaerolineae bacterium]